MNLEVKLASYMKYDDFNEFVMLISGKNDSLYEFLAQISRKIQLFKIFEMASAAILKKRSPGVKITNFFHGQSLIWDL